MAMGTIVEKTMTAIAQRKPYKVELKKLDGWWTASCVELCVAGSGPSRDDALQQLTLSMRSALTSQVSSLRDDWRKVSDLVEIVPSAE